MGTSVPRPPVTHQVQTLTFSPVLEVHAVILQFSCRIGFVETAVHGRRYCVGQTADDLSV